MSSFLLSKSSPSNTQGDFFCGAILISDRWAVTASHCYDDFGGSQRNEPRPVKMNSIRDNTIYREVVETKRVFKHPLYEYPNLYNDIAVIELGRRVEYDYEKYGDTPVCLDQGLELDGKVGTVEGYGLTEDGTRGAFLEANVTIISNKLCKEILEHNTTNNNVAAG